jgi:predicted glutamine amidotransferase
MERHADIQHVRPQPDVKSLTIAPTVCRLFAMSGGRRPVRATFWLLDAPDSLALQSHRNPDGYGIATFDVDGTPEVDKRPAAAYADAEFAREARDECSTTFLAHVRFASVGALEPENTHPFLQEGRVFAHNGTFGDLDALDARLDADRALVGGDTDSERYFALITALARDRDVGTAIAEAARWIATEVPVLSLNCIVATATDLWALRYPETNELYVLERPGAEPLDATGTGGRMRIRSGDVADQPVVLIASEPMDDEHDWRLLEPGELIHVDADLGVTSTLPLSGLTPRVALRPE